MSLILTVNSKMVANQQGWLGITHQNKQLLTRIEVQLVVEC